MINSLIELTNTLFSKKKKKKKKNSQIHYPVLIFRKQILEVPN